MKARVERWGNDLVLRIPKAAAGLGWLVEGAEVGLSVDEGRLIVRPVRGRKYTLDELLAQVTDANLHGEIDAGPSVGKEAW